MNDTLEFIIGSLAAWRATHLLHAEAGPAGVFERLRAFAGHGTLGHVLDCFYCLSLWVAAPIAMLTQREWGERGLVWFGLSAAAIGLERINGRWTLPAVASYFEDPPEDVAPAEAAGHATR
jgi:hypothetical protein